MKCCARAAARSISPAREGVATRRGDARLLDVLDRRGQAQVCQLDAALAIVAVIVAALVGVRLVLAEGLARFVVVARFVLDLGLEVLGRLALLTLKILSFLLSFLLLLLLLLIFVAPPAALRASPLALILLFLELARVLQFLRITRERGTRANACAERGGVDGRVPRRIVPAQDVLVPAVHAHVLLRLAHAGTLPPPFTSRTIGAWEAILAG